MNLDYWDLKKILSEQLFPRQQRFFFKTFSTMRGLKSTEAGSLRKSNYAQFNLLNKRWEGQQLLFKKDVLKNFVEISSQKLICPTPLDIDLYDSLTCPYLCVYCFSNKFRSTLYNFFFDNTKSIGMRSCASSYFIPKMERLLSLHEGNKVVNSEMGKAFKIGIPIKIGCRYENLLPMFEKKQRLTLKMIELLASHKYPFIVNTKSPLIGEDEYLKALSLNKEGAMVQISLVTSNPILSKRLEPGSPSPKQRLQACRNLTSAGIHVVVRMTPFMPYINDSKDDVDNLIGELKEAGVKNVISDVFGMYVDDEPMRNAYEKAGCDIIRMKQSMNNYDIQSLLIEKFLHYFISKGINVSCEQAGNTSLTSHTTCCAPPDNEQFSNYSAGNVKTALKFIINTPTPVGWGDYEKFVASKGGFLSESLRTEVHNEWNLDMVLHKGSFPLVFASSNYIKAVGSDESGIIWCSDKGNSRVEESLKNLLKGAIA